MCELASASPFPYLWFHVCIQLWQRHQVQRCGEDRKDLDESLKDKDVIVVEDIVDSGRTLSYLLEWLEQRTGFFTSLLDKPERRVIDVFM